MSTTFRASGTGKGGLSLVDTVSVPTCPATVSKVCEASRGWRVATSSEDRDDKVHTQHFKLHEVPSRPSSQPTARGADRSPDHRHPPLPPLLLQMSHLIFSERRHLVQETELINSNAHETQFKCATLALLPHSFPQLVRNKIN